MLSLKSLLVYGWFSEIYISFEVGRKNLTGLKAEHFMISCLKRCAFEMMVEYPHVTFR